MKIRNQRLLSLLAVGLFISTPAYSQKKKKGDKPNILVI